MPTTIDKALRAAVKAALAEGQSFRTLGSSCNVAHTQLSRWYAGSRTISLSTVQALCDHFGMHLTQPRRKGKA